MKKFPGVLVAGALLSNCGGGGGGGTAVPAPVNGSPVLAQAQAQVSIKIPNRVASQLRYGKYIPASAGSVRISVVAVNGAPPSPAIADIVQPLSPTAQGCSNATGSLICKINATLPIANVTLAVSLYQSADGLGPPLATNTVTANIVSGVTTNVSLTLGGVPASVSLGGPVVTAADGTTQTIQLPVTVRDASGATIIAPGTYSSPVNFTISGDPNGALSFANPQLAGPAQTGQTTQALTYNSAKALTSATITATITGATPATEQVNPLVYTPTTLTKMVINGATASVQVSEAGYSGAFAVSGASPNTTSCVQVNCTPATAGGSVTINVSPASVANLATLAVADSNGITAHIPLGVASAGGGPGIPGNPSFFFDAINAGATSPRLPVAGADGNVWFVESQGSLMYPAAMAPTTGVPTAGPSPFAIEARTPFVALANISSDALGPDGKVWFVDSSHRQIDVVATPGGPIVVQSTNNLVSIPDVIGMGPDNQMWIYGTRAMAPTSAIMEMAPNGATSLMTLTGATLGTVSSMLTGPDGNLWFTQTAPSAIGTITPGGFVTLYSGASGLTGTPNPGLAIGADGCMWFTENSPNAVTKIRPGSGNISEYTIGLSALANPIGGIAEGGDGNIWFAEQGTGSVARVTTSGVISEYSSGGNQPTAMVLAPNGQLWFVEQTKASLGWLTY